MEPVQTVEIACCNCRCLFWIPKSMNDDLLRTKETFHCPNGHGQSYQGKTDAQKLQDEKGFNINLRRQLSDECSITRDQRKQIGQLRMKNTKLNAKVKLKK